MSIERFIIQKENITSIPLIGARFAGERAIITADEARKKQQGNNPFNGQINAGQSDTPLLYKSELGTQVMADVTFKSVSWTDVKGKRHVTKQQTFQAILIDLTFPRNIVKTEIQGRNGAVKEYIGEGDAQIAFRGVITGQNGQYPESKVQDLMQLLKAPIPIEVICSYLNNKGVYSIVFEDRTLSQEEGGYSYQTFSLNAISDTPIELQIQ